MCVQGGAPLLEVKTRLLQARGSHERGEGLPLVPSYRRQRDTAVCKIAHVAHGERWIGSHDVFEAV